MDLSNGELQVMELLWQGDVLDENGEIQALELSKILKEKYGISKTSAYTFIGRLIEKGVLDRRYPKYTISVIMSREEALLSKQKEVFQKLFKGSLVNMCKTFLSTEKVSEEELAEMKNLLDNFEVEDSKGDSRHI